MLAEGESKRYSFVEDKTSYFISFQAISKESKNNAKMWLDLTTFYITKNNQKKGKIHSPVKSKNSTHRGVSPLSNSSIPQSPEKSTPFTRKLDA